MGSNNSTPQNSDDLIIKQPDEVKSDAIVSITVIAVITLLFIGYYIYSMYVGLDNTIYVRLKQFYGSSLSQLSLGLVIVFLVSDVVNSFNNSIMFPVIRSSFPNENVWNNGVSLPRGQVMYPGLFLQSIVSFVLSIGIMFMIGEILNVISKQFNRIKGKQPEGVKTGSKLGGFYTNILYLLVISVFVVLIVWNVKEIVNPTEEIVTSNYQSPRFATIM